MNVATQADLTAALAIDANSTSAFISRQAPTLGGAALTNRSNAAVTPFAGVTRTDPKVGATDMLTISLTSATGGPLADGMGFDNLLFLLARAKRCRRATI